MQRLILKRLKQIIRSPPYSFKVMSTQPKLPPPPRPPEESECCNSDCTLCVKDIYEQEVKIWEEECRNILLKEAPRSLMSPTVYARFKLIEKTPVTHNTYLYTFDSKGFVEVKPGQHLILREDIGDSRITRQYTPISVPQPNDFTFKVLIKLYKKGIMSQQIEKCWDVGYEAEWRGPHGIFIHQPSKFTKYLMIAAGTGCAPMIGIAKQIVDNDSDITTMKLLYANRTYEDILFRTEINDLSQYWNFTCKHFISEDEEAANKKAYGENVVASRISLDDIKTELTHPQTRLLICGTREFDSAMLDYLNKLDVPQEHVFKF